MSEKKDEQPMEGRFSVDLSDLRRPVDDLFPDAHRQISLATNHCVSPPFGCGRPVTGFSDQASAREYKITGMCQACQDRMYSELADEEAEELAERFFDPDMKS